MNTAKTMGRNAAGLTKVLCGWMLLALLAAAVSACGPGFPGKVTGGGWMVSASGKSRDKAIFGFNGAQCLLDAPVEGHFTYVDKAAPDYPGGVRLTGAVTVVRRCEPLDSGDGETECEFCRDPATTSYEVGFVYSSTNPKLRGEGSGFICVQDNGEGSRAAPDTAEILITTGDNYVGYGNAGPIRGNIQAHACTCTDGLDNDDDGLIDAEDAGCQDAEGSYDPNGDEE